MIAPVVVDTGGLLRALARRADGSPTFPEFEIILKSAIRVIVPALILPEVDYFLRDNRPAMRKLVAEVFDPATRYEKPTRGFDAGATEDFEQAREGEFEMNKTDFAKLVASVKQAGKIRRGEMKLSVFST